jgi:uncharacterized protein YndB with AHSA1/START domain
VFEFLTDADKMRHWKGDDVTLDPRPGGLYRVDFKGRDVMRGEFVTVEPPHRLVFTWGWESEGNPVPPGSSTVEITLRADGDHTLLRLVHRDLPEAAREQHGTGWDHYLSRLSTIASGGDPGPDPWAETHS